MTKFSQINPETKKIWTRDQLFIAYQEEKRINQQRENGILTIDDYGNDFVNRCQIHGKEFNLAIQDLKNLFRVTKKLFA
tara:strand:- start:901 stop:1137 length:237 start_codon:yes stop_codon:yes gene_type:complete